jgi:nucleotide-binding universal stress UspA family protein
MTQSLHVKQILCPTDFSVYSARAFRHALALGHRFRARVRVVHVLPSLPSVAGSPLLPTPTFPSPEARPYAEGDLARFVEEAEGSGVLVTTEIRDGQPWRALRAAALELPADLVTLGTHGRSGFERFVLGSVTEKLLGYLSCPILTVCHEEGRTWAAPGLVKRILVATDFSVPAMEAVAFAVALATEARSALTVLHVIDGLPGAQDGFSYAVPELAPLRSALEERARPLLQAAAPDVLPSGPEVLKQLVMGRAHEKILEAAVAQSADLVVLGTRGHGPLQRIVFGSTSERVVREATCPVFTVPPPGGVLVRRDVEARARVEAPVAR